MGSFALANRSKFKLEIRIRNSRGERVYCAPVTAANGRLKSMAALVNGKPETHPEGTYYLRYTSESGKRVYERLGKDSIEALNIMHRRELARASTAAGLQVVEPAGPVRIDDAIARYLTRVAISRSERTKNEFNLFLPQFRTLCSKVYLHEITADDLLLYAEWVRQQGLAPRTVANRVARVTCFLRHYKITGLLAAHEKPRFVERDPQAYSEDQLRALFAACNDEERLLFRFFLYSGCREQEVSNASYRDINFGNKTLTTREKTASIYGNTVAIDQRTRRGFQPKDFAERTVPLPDSLIADLAERRKSHPHDRLIFPNQNGDPNGHFLRKLKVIAHRAGLNCGECINRRGKTCSEYAVCSLWQLHSFRRSFATMHQEAGVPIRRIQKWLGHASLETTLRYLDAAEHRAAQTREWVNRSFAAL